MAQSNNIVSIKRERDDKDQLTGYWIISWYGEEYGEFESFTQAQAQVREWLETE